MRLDPVRPNPVRPGAVIGVAAPSGPVDAARLHRGVQQLRRLGYRVRLTANVDRAAGFFAGTDAERAAAFTDLWLDPDVAGVVCARGGYGAMRLLPLLDLERLAAMPKFFCGYSDITALHLAFGAAGLVTFHGEMIAAEHSLSPYNAASLRRALVMAPALHGAVPPRPLGERSAVCSGTHLTIAPGVADGPLLGGNLSLLCALEGTPWAVQTAGRIVLLEDVAETPQRIDRMLTHLLLAGKLSDAAGIVFGFSPTCEAGPGLLGPDLAAVLTDRLGPLGMPVVYGLPLGHGRYRATVPLGVAAKLDAERGVLTF